MSSGKYWVWLDFVLALVYSAVRRSHRTLDALFPYNYRTRFLYVLNSTITLIGLCVSKSLVVEPRLDERLGFFDIGKPGVAQQDGFGVFERNGEAHFFGSSVAAFADNDGVYDPEHIEFTDKIRYAALG